MTRRRADKLATLALASLLAALPFLAMAWAYSLDEEPQVYRMSGSAER